MSRRGEAELGEANRVPRTRGDEPVFEASVEIDVECSPHPRG